MLYTLLNINVIYLTIIVKLKSEISYLIIIIQLLSHTFTEQIVQKKKKLNL